MRIPALALANLLLAGGIIAVGLPGMLGEFRRLPAEVTAGAVEQGLPVDEAEIEEALPPLEQSAATSPSAREDLAMALLSGAGGDTSAERLDRAVREFRTYLAEVPGDSRAWTLLAQALVEQGAREPARAALEMSILTAPWMPGLPLARCALGIDLYPILDQDGRRLVAEQFRIAAERDPHPLAELVRQKHAVLIARVMLAGSPDAMAKFERELSSL